MGRGIMAAVVTAGLAGCAGPAELAMNPPGIAQADFVRCLSWRGFFVEKGKAVDGSTDMLPPQLATATLTGFAQPVVAKCVAADQTCGPGQSGATISYESQGTSRLSSFLDCYVGEIGGDPEKAALRAHIVVTLLAQLGADALRLQPPRDAAPHAARLISLIYDAETRITAASRQLTTALQNTAGTASTLPTYLRNRQAEKILEVAIEVERIHLLGTWSGIATAVSSALSGGSLVSLATEAAESASKGLLRLGRAEYYGSAYLQDARAALAGTVTLDTWGDWDEQLENACVKLRGVAGSSASCVPSASELQRSLAAAKAARAVRVGQGPTGK